ncbi:uncharacterized protein N7459_004502 [Penicillium hispanicum]|uniref:uncharacterized protein n=1 Tax=Penicillium hispanicum TaxID=1080232 RepID=UPI002540249F|nr:uncharacterized protein N7459_004502 [Penicillium hispanicum]KAJ5584702.1 hypothetical protein N7459_004502 [Penicillium hispanicum]
MDHVDGGSPKNDGEWSRQRIAAMRTALEAARLIGNRGFQLGGGCRSTSQRRSQTAKKRAADHRWNRWNGRGNGHLQASWCRLEHDPYFGQQSGVRPARKCRSARLLVLCSMQLSHRKWPVCAFRRGGKAKNVAEATAPDAARIHQRDSTARSESTTSEHYDYQTRRHNSHLCHFGTLRGSVSMKGSSRERVGNCG